MTNQNTTADATIENIVLCAAKLARMGPVVVRFTCNRGGFAILRFLCTTDPSNRFDGVPLVESDDYDDPFNPARIVAVIRDPNTGTETEKIVYGEAV